MLGVDSPKQVCIFPKMAWIWMLSFFPYLGKTEVQTFRQVVKNDIEELGYIKI
jgi:hypothetical protein